MTPEQLSELEQLEKAATCAPWKGDEFEAVAPKAQTAIPGNVKMVWAADYHMNEWDAKFVLALRNAAPSLLQSLRSLMAENEALKNELKESEKELHHHIVDSAIGQDRQWKQYMKERDSLQAQHKDAVDALSAVQVDAIQCPQQQGEIIQFVVTAWAIGKVRKTLAKLKETK